MKKPGNQILVIFGASGDLSKRKLIPALFHLYQQDLLPEKFAILGVGRTPLSDSGFRNRVTEFLPESGKVGEFVRLLFYEQLEPSLIPEYQRLKDRIGSMPEGSGGEKNILFYLATPPPMYGIITENISLAGLNRSEHAFRRIVVEKPFGTDLDSARKLNAHLLHHFSEEQIYRIDHYLGKETVQNMLVTRFSNGIFEPLWNQHYIRKVEITSAETLGVEGRGGYYEQAGALRDMVQNHLLQLVAFTAMEPPGIIEATAIRNEIIKVFQSLHPFQDNGISNSVIRGQYTASTIKGQKIPGYRQEKGVDPESRTETFIALRFYIDNWRWAGVPFYIRTGKRLPTKVTEIVVHFKQVPHHLFNISPVYTPVDNQLIIRIQPDEGILLRIGMKTPGSGFQIQTVNMDFHYSDLGDVKLSSAYERLLLDCMQGDATLYTRGDAVEEAWKFIQPVIDSWQSDPEIPVYGYPAGTWGPETADSLMPEGQWRYPCKNLSNDGEYCEL